MSQKVALVYTDEYLKYDFGYFHPLRPEKKRLAYDLIRAYGITDDPRVMVKDPGPPQEEPLLLVHTREFVDYVKEVSEVGEVYLYTLRHGIGFGDNPPFKGMYEATAVIVSGAVFTCELVMEGEAEHAFNLAGGMHHAQEDWASGFCIFNDLAVAIRYLKQKYGLKRILYVDLDAHHGDGVQWIFYSDPEVLTLSLHETGRYLFPGTGFVHEMGQGPGKGYSVNVPLPILTFDEAYLYAFWEIVPPLARAFQPEVIITQTGTDMHFTDPLTDMRLTSRPYEEVPGILHELAHELCDGRWVCLGGGGYDPTVVPRLWTLMFSRMVGVNLPNPIPEEWLILCRKLTGMASSRTLRDGDFRPVDEPAKRERIFEEVKKVVEEVKEKIFPLHGIG